VAAEPIGAARKGRALAERTPGSRERGLGCGRKNSWDPEGGSPEGGIGHNFLVQRMRHNRNRRPYELRICDECDWHSVQDEEHILLDCLHEHCVSIRTHHRQLVFPPQYEDSPTRLRTF